MTDPYFWRETENEDTQTGVYDKDKCKVELGVILSSVQLCL